jgi:hypothetical protein
VKVSILIPHFRVPQWVAICVHFFKKFPIGVDHEIIVCDNSPGHDSIKVLTETSLGEGVKIVQGQADFPSHGKGYFKAYQAAEGDWIFTAETDSFPICDGWFKSYEIASNSGYQFIAPPMPMAAGRYGHPAGALVSREVLELHQKWRDDQKDWVFIPGSAPALELSERGYHVVIREDELSDWLLPPDVQKNLELWRDDVGPWQEMRSYDDDAFESYGHRTGITHWSPQEGKVHHLRIGYEPGQHLSYFAQSHGVKCMDAPVYIQWMPGWEGKQAAYSDVFGTFRHVWAGTSAFCDGIPSHTRTNKLDQMNEYMSQLPVEILKKCKELELP